MTCCKTFPLSAIKQFITPVILTSVLGGGEWSNSRPGRFTPGNKNRWALNKKLGGCQSRSVCCREGKKLLLPWIRTPGPPTRSLDFAPPTLHRVKPWIKWHCIFIESQLKGCNVICGYGKSLVISCYEYRLVASFSALYCLFVIHVYIHSTDTEGNYPKKVNSFGGGHNYVQQL